MGNFKHHLFLIALSKPFACILHRKLCRNTIFSPFIPLSLFLPHRRIFARMGHQFLMRPDINNLTAIHDYNTMRQFSRAKTMGYHYRTFPFCQLFKLLVNLCFFNRVDSGCGFIQYDETVYPVQPAGDCNPLPLPS